MAAQKASDNLLTADGSSALSERYEDLISGADKMSAHVRAFDWQSTSLGPIESWSPSLLTSVNLILSCPLPMQLFWGSELIVLYNDALIPILTNKHPLALGQPASEVWGEAWSVIGPQLQQVQQTRKGFHHNAFLVPVHRDGVLQDAWWDYSYSPVLGPDGTVEGILDVVRDVTETVLAEQAKDKSEERLTLAMEAADLGLWTYDPETGVVFADEQMHRIFGSPDQSGSVAYWLDLLHPEDSERVNQHFSEALAGLHPYDIEYRILHPDGVHWIRSKGRVVERQDQAKRMFAVVEDITAKKATEDALRASRKKLKLSQATTVRTEEQLQIIIDALPAAISYLDPDCRYVRVNKTYEEWFSTPAETIIGKTVDEVLGEAAAATVRSQLQKALFGQHNQFEYTIAIQGQERILSVTHLPDLAANGKVRGVIVQGRDVTEQRRSEQLLLQTEKLAAVGRLASSIAHEINNPLEAVTNLIFLAHSQAVSKQTRDYLEIAERELRRMSAVANKTLRFHKQSTNQSSCSCVSLISDALMIYEARLINSKITVDKRKRAEEPVVCFADDISQVIGNLIGNAIDAMHGEGGRLLLRSRQGTDWRTGRKGLIITVADTGTGMSQETVKHLFEAFYTTKGIGGTGLGLWISQGIVNHHHGRLTFRTSQNPAHRGTVFAMFLPYAVEPS